MLLFAHFICEFIIAANALFCFSLRTVFAVWSVEESEGSACGKFSRCQSVQEKYTALVSGLEGSVFEF